MNSILDYEPPAVKLQCVPFVATEVLSLWDKAERAWSDSRNPASSLNGRLRRACDSAVLASLAIARTAGYRVYEIEQRQAILDFVVNLVGRGELADALIEMSQSLALRDAVEYEPFTTADSGSVAAAMDAATRVINLGAKHLRAERPDLGKRIHMVKG